METLLRSSKLYREGRPLLVFNALLHYPGAMRALAGKLDWGCEAVLTDRERELVILRTTARVRCAQVIRVHRVVAERVAGLSRAEVAAIQGEIKSPGFGPRKTAFLLIADALCGNELIEAVVVVGYYRMVGALQNALGVPAEDAFELSDGAAR